ncbi:MAG: hypothetical protein ACYTEZ_12640 [Planctomycetota bacterium]|jgi:hypothetical protein
MRALCVWAVLLAAPWPVRAADPDEEIRRAIQALEVMLRTGDELRRQGHRETALTTYRGAVETYRQALQKLETAAAPETDDPPADLGHLASTPADQRQLIDALVARMLDPQAGRDSLTAKQELAAIGRPTFPVILGAMAGIRDRITDVDSTEERLLESSLKLADECLRGMDSYLDAQGQAPIRPGADRGYIEEILRVHYRRWKEMRSRPRPRAGVAIARGRRDPPAMLGHLPATPEEQRQRIDELVKILLDPEEGRRSLDAKQKLAAIGLPAFPVILGAMAGIRDRITDDDSFEERLLESSLKLADECLRGMDSFLDSKGKAPIRPGTDRKYIQYILRLHYRRWKEVLEPK